MDQTVTCALLLLSLSATLGKYVYINKRVTWHEARMYCRLHHTDLAPISDYHDMWQLSLLVVDVHNYFWIGLERNLRDHDKWMWSGGGQVSRFFWAWGEPENRLSEDYGVIYNYEWHDAIPTHFLPFYCYSAVVVRERKTWEEALEYCREHHRDLASVTSETEMLLIQREIAKNETTRHIWIGLHFFPGDWLWVDGKQLSYEAWGPEGQPACPDYKRECVAIRTMGGMQSGNGTFGVNISVPNVSERVNDATAGVHEHVWEAHECEERLHFICY